MPATEIYANKTIYTNRPWLNRNHNLPLLSQDLLTVAQQIALIPNMPVFNIQNQVAQM
jgi:hypothetical protein